MTSHHKPEAENLPSHEPIRTRKPARHIEPRVRHLPVLFNGRPRSKGAGKPWVCVDCGTRDKTRDDITKHWWAEHAPKPVVLEDIVCVSVSVEGE